MRVMLPPRVLPLHSLGSQSSRPSFFAYYYKARSPAVPCLDTADGHQGWVLLFLHLQKTAFPASLILRNSDVTTFSQRGVSRRDICLFRAWLTSLPIPRCPPNERTFTDQEEGETPDGRGPAHRPAARREVQVSPVASHRPALGAEVQISRVKPPRCSGYLLQNLHSN